MFTSLDTPRLRLRRLVPDDTAALLAYRNDPSVARYQDWETFTIDDARRMIERESELEPGTPGEWFQFAVTLLPDFQLIGDCGLFIDAADRRLAEIGFTFAPSHQGKGLATEGVKQVVAHAFDELGVHRVKAVIDARNEPASRLARRLGMRQEAHFVQHSWFKGAWSDELVFALLASEWRSPAQQRCLTPRA
jgi:aminoglycoside 6'-N-acetyltransferase